MPYYVEYALSKGTIIITLDDDLQHSPEEIPIGSQKLVLAVILRKIEYQSKLK